MEPGQRVRFSDLSGWLKTAIVFVWIIIGMWVIGIIFMILGLAALGSLAAGGFAFSLIIPRFKGFGI